VTPSLPNSPPGTTAGATRAKTVRQTSMAAKAVPATSNDPNGLLRLQRSHAQTPRGLKRLANAITRDAIGIPLTRKQRAEMRAQQPKLDAKDIDKNSYRAPMNRQRSAREMKNRRKPGWTDCKFVLPRVSLEGLRLLAITMAAEARQLSANEPLGYRRRYPKTKNFFVVLALNHLFEENDMPEFCVQEVEPMPGRVRRFVGPRRSFS
jgi:hypothetical protein